MDIHCLKTYSSGLAADSATANAQKPDPVSINEQSRVPNFGNALPCSTQLLLKPSLEYLAESAILSRLSVAVARPWMNRPSNVKDATLNIDQKRQGFWERTLVECFGTPTYIMVMHGVQDLVGNILEKLGLFKAELKVSSLPRHQLERANQVLEAQMGKTGVWGSIIFEPHTTGFGYYLEQLDKVGLSELKSNPAFVKTAQQWFYRVKMGTSLTVLGGMIASALYGGIVIQKMNDRWFAPLIARRLRNHEDLHLSDKDLTLQI